MKKTIANNARRRQTAIELLQTALTKTLAATASEVQFNLKAYGVCDALWQAAALPLDIRTHEFQSDVAVELTDIIADRLGEHGYVHEWLMAQDRRIHNYLRRELEKRRLPELLRGYAQIPKMIEYRQAWVRDMIRTLEQGGTL